MSLTEDYIAYIGSVRRYSDRTRTLYTDILKQFREYSGAASDEEFLDSLKPSLIRSYEVFLLDGKSLDPRTVNLHISVLSGFCVP